MGSSASRFTEIFPQGKPVFAMLHLGGETPDARFKTALREALMLDRAGVDGIIVENYFGTIPDVAAVLSVLKDVNLTCKIGINILGDMDAAFDMARRFDVDFIQVDSVCGHLPPSQDATFAADLANLRSDSDVLLLGGVRFKYMPVRSGRSVEDDLILGRDRCDAIVVTSDATGQETDLDKIRQFRDVLGPGTPLIVGAGLRPDNVGAQFAIADGGIVGSWLKENHVDVGAMRADHVATFLDAARSTDAAPQLF